MNKFDNQISRMKAMMNYGLQTESKSQYSDIEYQRIGADGKTYGIIREGAKFYIKVSNKTENVLKENFDYIGGFRNRKDYEYTSYANALKNFEMKMHSINEASNKKDSIIIDAWNPDRKEMLTVEATDKMRKEIERQRQIMGNVSLIQEKKNYTVNLADSCCTKVDKECAATQKDNIVKKSDGKGEPTETNGDPFTDKTSKQIAKSQKTNIKKEYKPVMESEDVLGWNENEDYLDVTHGTQIGDDAPFTEKANNKREMKSQNVEESVALHSQSKNQNSPTVGVGNVGDGEPFDETIQEEVEEGFFHNDDIADDEQLEDTPEEIQLEGEDMEMGEEDAEEDFLADEEPMEDETEEDFEGDLDDMADEEPMEGETEVDFESDLDDMADEAAEEDEFDGDMETRLSAIEDLLAKIANKVGVNTFEDDDLYDEEDDDEDIEIDAEMDIEEPEVDDEDFSNDDDEDDVEVFESKNYRKAMLKEEEQHYFGQHPAYEKEPMTLPDPNHYEMDGYFDIHDDSVENDMPYGQEIGDDAPFEIQPKQIENAIAESIRRILKKKI